MNKYILIYNNTFISLLLKKRMTKIDINLTAFYSKKEDKFEFYSGDIKIDNSFALSETGFENLKKFAVDVLFKIACSNINNPEYVIKLTKGDELGDFRIGYPKKPSEETRDELIKNLNSRELIKGAKNLVEFCLKDKKF